MLKISLLKKGISSLLWSITKTPKTKAYKKLPKSNMSYLQWKSPKGKINPQTFGYVLPNGNINFSSEQNAINYAKTRIVRALNSEKPNEKAIILKGKQVLDEINGSIDTVDFSNYTKDLTGTTLLHGHPEIDGISSPLSLNDLLFMLSKKLKQITAYNKNGEYSIFKGKILDSSLEEGKTICSKYAKMLASFAPKEVQPKIEGRMHININPLYADIDMAYKALSRPISEQQAFDFEKQLQISYLNGNYAKAMHKWLKSSAEKVGFKYETNYSDGIIKS